MRGSSPLVAGEPVPGVSRLGGAGVLSAVPGGFAMGCRAGSAPGMNGDQQFDAVIAAVASFNRRRAREKSPEQIERERREAHRNDPRHQKSLARRRKRKRGGPK